MAIHMKAIFICLGVALVVPAAASANERRFTYTYESPTLPAGTAELEPWTTVRAGRDDYYVRGEHRLELEFGLTDRLQTAFYVNFAGYAAGPANDRREGFEYQGVSSEWKLSLLDPVADPLGFALYLEGGLSPLETEIEAKVIVDRVVGPWILALNLVAEWEFEREEGETVTETGLETDVGVAYRFDGGYSLGLEQRTHTEITSTEGYEHTAFFVGPSFAYATERYWIALTALVHPFAVVHGSDRNLELDEHEWVDARLLLGFRL